MPLARINKVEKSANDRIYATTANGTVLFPRSSDLGDTLKEGQYVNYLSELQKKTTDVDGNLVDLPETEWKPINRIVATFDKVEEAKAAMKEEKILNMEVDAEIAAATVKLHKEYNLTADMVA